MKSFVAVVSIASRSAFQRTTSQDARNKTYLSNLRHGVGIFLQGFQELARSTACNGTQVFNQFRMCHTNTSITQGQGSFGFVERNAYFEGRVRAVAVFLRLGEGQVTILVNGISRIGNQFTHKDFLVLIQRVDDNIQHARNFRLKGEMLRR